VTEQSQPETVEQQPASFIDSLPEDLRGEPSLKNFTDAGALAKSYVHAQRMIGADKIALPGQSATDDEWRGVYSKLGMPAEASDYEYEAEFDEQEHEAFRNAAHAAGLNGRQAQQMAEFLQTQGQLTVANFDEATEQARFEGEQELRAEFGAATEQKIERAQLAAKSLGIDMNVFDEVQLADGRSLGDHPFIVKLFAGLADQLGEDTLEGATKELVMTPDEAGRKITELVRQGTPYWDSQHPEHRNYVDEVLRLRGYQFPDNEG
jgi:hypothetical protein